MANIEGPGLGTVLASDLSSQARISNLWSSLSPRLPSLPFTLWVGSQRSQQARGWPTCPHSTQGPRGLKGALIHRWLSSSGAWRRSVPLHSRSGSQPPPGGSQSERRPQPLSVSQFSSPSVSSVQFTLRSRRRGRVSPGCCSKGAGRKRSWRRSPSLSLHGAPWKESLASTLWRGRGGRLFLHRAIGKSLAGEKILVGTGSTRRDPWHGRGCPPWSGSASCVCD